MAFYKYENESFSSGSYITGYDDNGNGYDLNELDHAAGVYQYPVNGWYWFDTEEEANTFFNL